MKNVKNNKGFSLVELIVVIAIMAVLVGVMAPQFIKFVESSRVSTDMQNVTELKQACEAYSTSNEGVDMVITITGTTTKTAVVTTPTGLTATTLLMSPTVNMQSSKWPAGPVTYSLSGSTGVWTIGGGTDFKNTGDTTKDMNAVFGL